MKGMKLCPEPQVRKVAPPQRGNGTPFMAQHLEEALTGGPSARPHSRDTDMSAFNKLVSSMKASGTLPTHPKTSTNSVSIWFLIYFVTWAITGYGDEMHVFSAAIHTNAPHCDAAFKRFHCNNQAQFENVIDKRDNDGHKFV